MKTVRHPAKYTDSLIPLFAQMLGGTRNVLDPFAGTCKIARIRDFGYTGDIYANELEPEWALQAPLGTFVTTCDAEHLPYPDGFFDAICTSCTYANRMADHHNARDASRRNTYTHALGRQLTDGNTGAMQWGDAYRDKHRRVWAECKRVLGGSFILNVSDHIRKGERISVVQWHIECLRGLGFRLDEHHKITTPRLRYGANGNLRVEDESVLKFTL